MSMSSMATMPRRSRCAVYTRKSSEEGLDMEFNSLDAQRDACEAYVTSQKAEGWVALRDTAMMTVASPAARWIVPRSSNLSAISRRGSSTSSSSTRSTACRDR